MVIGRCGSHFRPWSPSRGFIFSVLPAPAELRGRAQAGLIGCAWGQGAGSAFGCFLLELFSADLGQPSQGAV